jgi:hypothetical protein
VQGRRRTIAALGVGALIAIVGAAPAWAGSMTATRSVNTVTLQTTAGDLDEEVRLMIRGGNLSFIGNAFGTNTDVDAGTGCTNINATDVHCGAGVTRLVLRPGAGDDAFQTRTLTGGDVANINAVIDADMGPGDDSLSVGDNTQAVVALGGDGNDGLFSGPAVDRLDGGTGSDSVGGGLGRDEMFGGPDLDTVFYTDHSADVIVDLDNAGNDGQAGENDLVQDFEGIFGGGGNDVLTGNDGLNDLSGGNGADRITGGGGFDRIEGGDGNDTIFAADGLADTIDCAAGADVAFTDDVDIPFLCEDRRSSPDLQPDRDGDGVDKPLDCNDLDGTVRPGAFDRPGDGIDQDCDGADDVDTDRDRDGFPAGFDCDDGNRAIHPGARERLGNRVDEDCDKVADPFPAFPTTILLAARVSGVTDVVGLVLVDLEGRERVRITCKGPGCAFKTKRARAGRRAESLILDRLVRGTKLRPGAKLTVRMTRRDGVRKTVTFTARAGKFPRQKTACKAPRNGRVARCR